MKLLGVNIYLIHRDVSVWLLTVVCGEAVDDVQVLPQGLHVLVCSQHGTDLRSSFADLPHVFLTQEEVMRCHLTGDLDALLLCCSDDQDLGNKEEVQSLIIHMKGHLNSEAAKCLFNTAGNDL